MNNPEGVIRITLISLIHWLESNFYFDLSNLADFWINYMFTQELIYDEYIRDSTGKWQGRSLSQSDVVFNSKDLALTTANYIRTPLIDILSGGYDGESEPIQCRYIQLFGPFIVLVGQDGLVIQEIEVYEKLEQMNKTKPLGIVINDLVKLADDLTYAFYKKDEVQDEDDNTLTLTKENVKSVLPIGDNKDETE